MIQFRTGIFLQGWEIQWITSPILQEEIYFQFLLQIRVLLPLLVVVPARATVAERRSDNIGDRHVDLNNRDSYVRPYPYEVSKTQPSSQETDARTNAQRDLKEQQASVEKGDAEPRHYVDNLKENHARKGLLKQLPIEVFAMF